MMSYGAQAFGIGKLEENDTFTFKASYPIRKFCGHVDNFVFLQREFVIDYVPHM